MHLRAYDAWAAEMNGPLLPSAEDLLAGSLAPFLDYSVVAQLGADDADDVIVHVGRALTVSEIAVPVNCDEVHPLSLVSRIVEHRLETVANRVPVGFEAEFVDQDDRAIRYRAIALPCSANGAEVDTVIGVISSALESELVPNPVAAPADDPDAAPDTIRPQAIIVDGNFGGIPSTRPKEVIMTYQSKLEECTAIDGAIAAALVDADSGMALGTAGNTKALDLEVAAAGNTNVLKAKYSTMSALNLKEEIEDILITLGSQIHMIRPATSDSGKGLFIYLALDKKKANLAMARHKLRSIEQGLEI